MKKTISFLIFSALFVVGLTQVSAQTLSPNSVQSLIETIGKVQPISADPNLIKSLTEKLQELIPATEKISPTPTLDPNSVKSLIETIGKVQSIPVAREKIMSLLPDVIREDDYIVQLTDLEIKDINTDVPNTRAVFVVKKDVNWKCLLYEREEDVTALPCPSPIVRSLFQGEGREFAIKIVDDTILLLRNRLRAKLEDFKVGDVINVYGYMDKDNYGVEALIVRKIREKPTFSVSGILVKQSDAQKAYLWGWYVLRGTEECLPGLVCPQVIREYLVKPANEDLNNRLANLVGSSIKLSGRLFQVTETKTGKESFQLIVAEKVLSQSFPPSQPPIPLPPLTPTPLTPTP